MSKFKLTQTAAEVQNILNNFNSLKSDAEGNLTASKNLGVDGKLTLKSLVSASNPDGDITKELGGGSGGEINLYCHRIKLTDAPNNMIMLNYFNTSDVPITRSSFITKIVGHELSCSGAISSNASGEKIKYIPTYLYITSKKGISCYAIDLDTNMGRNVSLDNYNFSDNVIPD